MASVKLYQFSGDSKAIEIQKRMEKHFGFLPQVFQAMGRNGDFLESALKVQESAGRGLDAKTRELIAIAVSAANGCTYCIDAHCAAAKQLGVTDEEITAALEVTAATSLFNKFNDGAGISSDWKK